MISSLAAPYYDVLCWEAHVNEYTQINCMLLQLQACVNWRRGRLRW